MVALAEKQVQTRHAKLMEYFQFLYSRDQIALRTIADVKLILQLLDCVVSLELPEPDASAGVQGQILLDWELNEHHFELEIFPTGEGVFFYYNRVTKETWDDDYHIGDEISDKVQNYLRLYL